ncbi:MAG: class II aldolase/adducin family protein [Acidobacteria bacterium]|nr:class II aldolase/adducin family protein [Acidobacteriota bacterium]
MTESESRQALVEIGRRLYAREYIVAGDGNLSVRLPGTDEILATPTGVCKGFLTPEMLVRVGPDGRKRDGTHDPSSELAMHLVIYRLRPDVQAVVHAHPPCGTGFAAAGLPLDKALISEVVLTLGCIPIAEYGTPTTQELADSVANYVPRFDALLLANHGALTYGPTLESAYFRMETLEHFARISLVARLLGGERPLDPSSVDKLFAIRQKAGVASPTPQICRSELGRSEASTDTDRLTISRRDLVELIAESVELAARILSAPPSALKKS